MALPPRRFRRPAVLALTTGLALALTGPTGVSGPAAADPPPPPPVAAGPGDGDAPVNSKPRRRDRLGRHDRELLARAQTKGQREVTILVATARAGPPAWRAGQLSQRPTPAPRSASRCPSSSSSARTLT